jgi:NAD-dependent SIR2 family protein deacetylase
VVLGSSLTVMSGLRFVHAATRRGLPVAIITAGPSRADAAADIRLTGRLGEVLPGVLDTLGLSDRA